MTDKDTRGTPAVHFDDFAEDYDQSLQKGLSLSGENRLYFARERIRWTAQRLASESFDAPVVLDYGCGTGLAVPLILEYLSPDHLIGIDVSDRSLSVARQQYQVSSTTFLTADEFRPAGNVDLIYCNGVFHHIPPSERSGVVRYLSESLRPGGVLALWENNPWNPGTRIVMSRIPFDRDAETLTSGETQRLLGENGFHIIRTDYLFIFPRALRVLRWIEPRLTRYPFGAQYMVMGRKD